MIMAQAARTARKETRDPTTHVEIGIDDPHGIVEVLNRVLADENVLYIKTKNYHWNVVGTNFYSVHKLLETSYESLDAHIDDVAERVRSLGGTAVGSMEEFLDRARLRETVGPPPDEDTMLRNLVDDHETVARHLRDDIQHCQQARDEGSMDLLIEVLRDHEKTAWMLRAIQGPGA